MSAKFYSNKSVFHVKPNGFNANISVIDSDTFTTASELENPCCLNFASHKHPGDGYKAVLDIMGPIRTQEEDLFRRSNLPELMDKSEVTRHYPLRGLEAFYCKAIVCKDNCLTPVDIFEVGVVTMPAVVNPSRKDEQIVNLKVKRILEISAVNGHSNLVLGAWGCGIFNNDPKTIAELFYRYLTGEFKGCFENVVFAIPGVGSHNYRIFESVLT